MLLALVLLQGVATPGGGINSGDIGKDDDGGQRPTQSPANQTPPGQPCYCLAANGARLDGYVIAWRWSPAPPTDVK